MQLLLSEDIDQDQILDAFREVEDEPSKMVKRLRTRARDIAEGFKHQRGRLPAPIDCNDSSARLLRLPPS